MSWFYFLLLACEQSSAPALNTTAEVDLRPKVRATIVSNELFSNELQVPATIQAIRSAVLVPRVPGRVSEVKVRIGDVVKKDDLLLTLEGGDYLAGFQEAKANKELAHLQAEQAALHLTRFETLRSEGAITEVQLEEASVNAKLASSQAKRADAGFEVAKNRLVDTELRAPFSGTIIARNVESGEMMGGPVQQPPLMIADLRNVRFVADVGEGEISGIQKEQKATLLLMGNKRVPVTIDRVNSAVDPIINTIQIEGVIDNTEHLLRHGQSAELSIDLEQKNQLSLSRSALINRRDGTAMVFLLLEDGSIQKKEVSYGRSDSGKVPILRGIKEGDKVLISGHTRLKDGDDVLVVGQE